MVHITQRLQERGINISPRDIVDIARSCQCDTAVILCQCEEKRVDHGYIGSNGDLVILIVRQCHPVTIMFRRSNQPLTPEALRVGQIIDKVGIQ